METLLDEILNKPFFPSDIQRDAVLSNSRYIRIVASAGAGKNL